MAFSTSSPQTCILLLPDLRAVMGIGLFTVVTAAIYNVKLYCPLRAGCWSAIGWAVEPVYSGVLEAHDTTEREEGLPSKVYPVAVWLRLGVDRLLALALRMS